MPIPADASAAREGYAEDEGGAVQLAPRPRPRSYSQFNNWLECPQAYRLARICRVPRRPGVWFPAGTATHASIERYLREIALPHQEVQA